MRSPRRVSICGRALHVAASVTIICSSHPPSAGAADLSRQGVVAYAKHWRVHIQEFLVAHCELLFYFCALRGALAGL